MNINYLVKTLVKSTVHPFTAIVMGKKLSNDVIVGLLIRAIMNDGIYVARQEKPCKATHIDSLLLYSDGRLYSPNRRAVIATLDAKSLEYINVAVIERMERDEQKNKMPVQSRFQKMKSLAIAVKKEPWTR